MKRRFPAVVIASLCCVSACQQPTGIFPEMLALADARVDADRLSKYLENTNPAVRVQAVRLLGQMRDSTAVPAILPLLAAPNPALRSEAAFALGQLGTDAATEALVDRLTEEQDLHVRLLMLEALGKTGDSTSVDPLLRALEDPVPVIRQEAALAIARFAYRRISTPAAIPRLTGLLKDDLNEIRWRAAYALMRLADSSAADALVTALADPDPRVRMHAARGLGRMRAVSAAPSLARISDSDGDWRVRAHAASALGAIGATRLHEALPLDDGNEHVRLTSLRALQGQAGASWDALPAEERAAIAAALKMRIAAEDSTGQTTWREKGTAAVALAALTGESAFDAIVPLASSSDPQLRGVAVRALARTKSRRVPAELLRCFNQGPGNVRMRVLEALPEYRGGVANRIASDALALDDAWFSALAGQYFAGDTLYGRQFGENVLAASRRLQEPVDPGARRMLYNAFADLKLSQAAPILREAAHAAGDPQLRKAASNALARLTGEAANGHAAPDSSAIPAIDPGSITALDGAIAVIETDKGDIEIELHMDAAPLTVLNFVKLARNGFYDGQIFHRVVPNFVIQSGDPRGDGYGGPGYAIRTEANSLRYLRGAIGMASAGPDTEGSQFFITHSAQPHLDGSYTLFGRVRFGKQVMDAIQVGDRITRIVVSE